MPAPSEHGPSEPALPLPRPPEPSAPRPFPILATLAPVLVSALLFAVTRSPFALLFAVLGPVAAVAGLGDARWQDRRHRKAERVRFERELERTRGLVLAAHARERGGLEARAPSAATLLGRGPTDAERWRDLPGGSLPVSIGTGTIGSAIAWETGASAVEPDARLASLREEAAVLADAPVILDAAFGIGIVASGPRGTAAANGILLQLVSRLHPRAVEVFASPAAGFGWLAGLPHWAGELGASGPVSRVELRARRRPGALRPDPTGAPGEESVVLVVAPSPEELPRACRVGVVVEADGRGRVLFAPGRSVDGPVSLSFVSEQECAAFARMLALAARREGVGDVRRELPRLVRFGELEHDAVAAAAGLPASLGVDAAGTTRLDLVSDGPHAVVGGTTGAGKSELLVSWILAMAASTPPERFTVLLVDFKGGAAFEPLRALPHCVGVVTDLDSRAAERALASLSAELRHRERVLGRAGVRSIDELPGASPSRAASQPGSDDRLAPDALARLVIVVDEYAALASTAPGLHGLFADLAARGRSLGIHLVLCTQRPAEGIRDSVLANCSLRLSLRVNNRADSESVVGSTAAAELPRNPPGRAILVRADGGPTPVQLALASPADVAAVAARWPAGQVRRPWLDPLPAVLGPDALPGASGRPGIAFGLLDLPEEQSREAACYDPDADGSLLVLGAHRSGKTGLLAALEYATAGAVRVPGDLEGAWDAVTGILERMRSGAAGGTLLLIDDLDVLVGRLDPEYRQEFLETVLAILREGRALGVHCVLTARQLTTGLHAVAAACEARLFLRLPDAQEHVAAGGERADFDAALPPGGGHWRGHRLQIVTARPVPAPSPSPADVLDLGRHRLAAVVSTAPAVLAARFGEAIRLVPLGGTTGTTGLGALEVASRGPRIPVADPEQWQSNLALLTAARAEGALLLHGCTTADLRMLTGRRVLPPPLAAPESCWLIAPGGAVSRVRLPPQTPSTSSAGV